MKTRGKLVASIAAILALLTVLATAVALRQRIADWIHPLKPIRIELLVAESAPGLDLVEKEFRGKKYSLQPDGPTNRDMAKVRATFDQNGRPALSFEMTDAGAEKLSRLTAQNIGKSLAILVDGRIVEVATIKGRISKSGELTGDFTRQEIISLVKELNGQ